MVAAKPSGGVHGGGVQEHVRNARERGMESGEASEGWGGVRLGSPHQQRCWQRRGAHIGHGGGMTSAWSPRGITSNAWCALRCPTWRPFLGWLCSELGYGPLNKVVPLLMLFDLYLGSRTIRAMD